MGVQTNHRPVEPVSQLLMSDSGEDDSDSDVPFKSLNRWHGGRHDSQPVHDSSIGDLEELMRIVGRP